MARYGMSHSLDDMSSGMGMFMDPLSGMVQQPSAMSFEFDNFGVTHQPVPAPDLFHDNFLKAAEDHATTAAVTSNPPQHGAMPIHESQHELSNHIIPQSDYTNPEQGTEAAHENPEEQPLDPDAPVIEIAINNVVCSFATRCHLNLKKIAMEGMNVIHKKECGMVSMKLRRPYVTASVWSSGKITCTGATSEEEAKLAARRVARLLQKIGFKTKVSNFRVVNVLGTCTLGFGVRINSFSKDHPRNASYEPELHPGVTYKILEPKATLKIFSTGSITITAPRVANIQMAVHHIFPLVSNYRMDVDQLDQTEVKRAQMFVMPSNKNKIREAQDRYRKIQSRRKFDDSDIEDWTDTDEDDSDSDDSIECL